MDASAAQQGQIRRRTLSPKRPKLETAGMADLFPYYAGFSFEWACEELTSIRRSDSDVVLDPWNGSGTTVAAAQHHGLSSIGIDLNPVVNIIAQLRVHIGEIAGICSRPSRAHGGKIASDDPLLSWLAPKTASRIRSWHRALEGISGPASILGLVALFRVVRRITRSFEGSNPTWVRRALEAGQLVEVSVQNLDQMIEDEQLTILQRLSAEGNRRADVLLVTASSTNLPLKDSSVDLILTSPPYLTRLDYAVAYARELAVLGIDIASDRTLRRELMGTTLTRPSSGRSAASFGLEATSLVEQVSSHQSKASSGYYLKQLLQYLDDLISSLDEISRVASPNARMTLVVQDSYYKDVHVKLAEICAQEAGSRGWTVKDWAPFEVTRLLSMLNTSAQAYKKGKISETVVTLERRHDGSDAKAGQ